MSVTEKDLRINLLYDSTKIKKLKSDLSDIKKRMQGLRGRALAEMRVRAQKTRKAISNLNRTIGTTRARLQEVGKQAEKTQTAFGAFWESSRMGALGFNGTLLSLLFFGMEMKRVFGGALRSIFDGYKKIIPESHKFNVMTTRLSANWEFFKFQLADAMANSKLFQRFIQFLINIIKKFQGLSEESKVFLVALLAAGVVLGTILFAVGVIGMGLVAMADMAIALGAAFGVSKLKALGFMGAIKKLLSPSNTVANVIDKIANTLKKINFKAVFSSIGQFFKGLSVGKIGNFGALITKVKTLFTNLFKTLGGKISSLWVALKAVFKSGWLKGVGTLLKGSGKALTTFVKKIPIVGWIIIAIETLWKTVEDMINSETSTWLGAVASAFSSVVIRAVESIIGFFTSLIDIVVNIIAWMVEGVAGMLGKNINIPKLDLTGTVNDVADTISESVDGWIADLEGNKQAREQSSTNAKDRALDIFIVDTEGNMSQGIQNEKQQSALDVVNNAMRFSGN